MVFQTFRYNPLSFLIFVMARKGGVSDEIGSQIPSRTSDDSATDTASVLGMIGDNVSTEIRV